MAKTKGKEGKMKGHERITVKRGKKQPKKTSTKAEQAVL